MGFQIIALADLPKREAPVKSFDREGAEALLTLVNVDGQTATDGNTYPDVKAARVVANKTKRLLARVLPDDAGKIIETRIFGVEDGKPVATKNAKTFGFVVYLAAAPAKKDETAKEEKPAKSK